MPLEVRYMQVLMYMYIFTNHTTVIYKANQKLWRTWAPSRCLRRWLKAIVYVMYLFIIDFTVWMILLSFSSYEFQHGSGIKQIKVFSRCRIVLKARQITGDFVVNKCIEGMKTRLFNPVVWGKMHKKSISSRIVWKSFIFPTYVRGRILILFLYLDKVVRRVTWSFDIVLQIHFDKRQNYPDSRRCGYDPRTVLWWTIFWRPSRGWHLAIQIGKMSTTGPICL